MALLLLLLALLLPGSPLQAEALSQRGMEATLPAPLTLTRQQPLPLPLGDLRLLGVEDSRCPHDVECVWPGQVSVWLQIQPEGAPATELQLTLPQPGHRPDGTAASQTLDGYRLTLVAVDPYPQELEISSLDDYRIQLQVEPENAP